MSLSAYDITTLKKRLTKLKSVLTSQYSISKRQRDERLIAETETRIAKISEWLGIKEKPGKEQKRKEISKTEFKKKLNEILQTKEPTEIMQIDTVEELKAIWPQIRGRNIQVKAPRIVMDEARKLQRQDLIRKRKR